MMRHRLGRSVLGVALCLAAVAHALVESAATRRCARPSDASGRMRRTERTERRRPSGDSIAATAARWRRLELRMSSTEPSREDEIRRKIADLKQEGRLKPKTQQKNQSDDLLPSPTDTPLDKMRKQTKQLQGRSVADEYAEKLGSKLGGRKGRQVGRMLGIDVSATSTQTSKGKEKRTPRLGALDVEDLEEDDDEEDDFYAAETEEERRERAAITSGAAEDAIETLRRNVGGGKESKEMDEDDLVDAVSRALSKAGGFPSMAGRELLDEDDNISTVPVTPVVPEVLKGRNAVSPAVSAGVKTSGVGGSWAPPSEQTGEDAYQPKVGTWGAFPRPRNISVAYGGGKRVGAGVKTDEALKQQSIEDTKERLRAYREKMGIEVQSEKDNADVIDEALQLAGRAMQRGSYSVGVSALEKVTKYCSTKSKLGGKVFLELAMAYEAEGKTDQAIGLYAALTKSPIEQIKMNADKLLYGLEAMNFMRNEAKLKEFSRKKAADTFIDATGFGEITKNFDKVYNTAYIDLDKGSQYYRMLTENVVRSTREARQILLKAVNKGEVDRMKVVQALRSISRHFDDALVAEKKSEEAKNVPVDYAGRPIIRAPRSAQDELASAIGMDGFVLSSPSQTLDSLDGEWRLQLMADKKGDGVDFFNSTLFWQAIDSSGMAYRSGSRGLRSTSRSGGLAFDIEERVLSRKGLSSGTEGGGGLLSMLLGRGEGGTAGEMMKAPQQVLTVDSALLVTRAIVKAQAADNVKDYFSVWRRVEPGTYARGEA